MEKLLYSIFTMLHASTQFPEFSVSHDETNEIAKAWAECAKYYPSLNLDPAIAAPINLFGACSIFVGSRVVSYKLRKSMARPQRAAPPRQQEAPAPIENPPNPGMTTQQVNGVHMPEMSQRPMPTTEMRTADIPGVGRVEFPPDHPLVGASRKPN